MSCSAPLILCASDTGPAKAGPYVLSRPYVRKPAPTYVNSDVSVPEVAASGKHHREAALVGGGNHFRILHRPARLHHRRRARVGDGIETVAEREERVGGRHRSGERVRSS